VLVWEEGIGHFGAVSIQRPIGDLRGAPDGIQNRKKNGEAL